MYYDEFSTNLDKIPIRKANFEVESYDIKIRRTIIEFRAIILRVGLFLKSWK